MRRTIWLVMAMVLLNARGASAGNDFNVNVVLGADGKPSVCTRNTVATEAKDDGVNVSVKDQKKVGVAPKTAITVQVVKKDGSIASAPLASAATALPRGDYTDGKYALLDASGSVIKDGKGKDCVGMLPAPPTDAPAPTVKTASEKLDPGDSLSATALNEQAMAFLSEKKITAHAVTGGVHGRTYRLYHLPDGTPAFPLPAHTSEEDRVELWLVLPVGAKAAVEIVTCDKVPDVRVHGSYKDVTAGAGRLHGAEVSLMLVAYSKPLQCSGTLTYKITPSGAALDGSTTTSLTLDPIYRFEWSVGYGFDFGKPRRLGLADQQPAGASGSAKVVVDPREFTGAKPIITLLVDVCGTNPYNLDWCDRFINPTIWLDPTRLDKGFGAGLTMRPFFGVGILAGVSVFKSTELANGVSANPGDVWTAAGGLPTKDVFNSKSLGLMLAATVDSDILTQLFK